MNKHLLEGMQCPKCSSFGPFYIEHTLVYKVWDDHEVIDSNAECGPGSWCVCDSCEHGDSLEYFYNPAERQQA